GCPLLAFSTASIDRTRMASAICFGEVFSVTVLASVTARPFVGWRKIRRRAAFTPGRARVLYAFEEIVTRMDAASAAKDRVDRALALLERRLLDLKSRAADVSRVPDDDLFTPVASSQADRARIHELESAGRDAAE